MGVAGGYLAARLSDEHQVVGFDRLPREEFDAVCAWGTSKDAITKIIRTAGLNFDDFVMHDGRLMRVDLGEDMVDIKLQGLCCFDKLRLVQELGDNVPIRFGRNVTRLPTDEDFDLVLDATGLARPLLPRIAEDTLIPCVQYKVKFADPPFDDFYIKPFSGLSGYFWYFPLDRGYAHVGAGDLRKRHLAELNDFMHRYGGEVVAKVGRPVRISPPRICEPFFDGKVIGVGESIGTVYPLLGEGIIPSLQCAEFLAQNLEDREAYRQRVLDKFQVYHDVYDFIMAKIRGRFSLVSQFPNLLRVFLHMRTNERRYGMKIRLGEFLKVIRSL
jgi:flavin-dependent dehydrogenase